jgi:hypothetical protein
MAGPSVGGARSQIACDSKIKVTSSSRETRSNWLDRFPMDPIFVFFRGIVQKLTDHVPSPIIACARARGFNVFKMACG